MIIPLYKGKVEKNECGENYRSISWSSISGKIYAEILVETVSRVMLVRLTISKGVSVQG